MIEPLSQAKLLGFTSQLMGGYVSHHAVSVEDLPAVIAKIYNILSDTARNPHSFTSKTSKSPAVPIEESVQDEYIVCLEDGRKLQILKRHLGTVYKMSLEEYKDRWNLPLDYPTVSPSYARRRSQIAKTAGFGIKGRSRPLKGIAEQDNCNSQRTVSVGWTGTV